MNQDYIIKILQELCETPSPSGFTGRAMEIVERELKSFNMPVFHARKGSLTSLITGRNKVAKKALAAHVDTLGAMVKDIKSNGRLVITTIGGVTGNSIECENCTVHTMEDKDYSGTVYTIKPSTHIHSDARTLERSIENMEIVLDEKVFSRKDVEELGIEIGDFISFDPRFRVTEKGFIKSRHLDDKASVAIILGVCKHLYDNNITPEDTIQLIFTVHEEIGHGGSCGISHEVEELLCIDMGAPGIGQNSDEYAVSICAKDSGGPYNYELKNKLVTLAKEKGIDFKVDIYPFYGSDGGAALRAGYDLKVGLIGAGIYASHSYERTHINSVMNTAKLILAFV